MSLSTMMIHTVAIVRPGTVTSRIGDTVLDWDNPTRTMVTAWVEPLRASEDEVLQDRSTLKVRFFFPAGTVVDNSDRLEWEGRTFQAAGPAEPFYRPTGLHHVVVYAQELEVV
jgi:hypothetical protein